MLEGGGFGGGEGVAGEGEEERVVSEALEECFGGFFAEAAFLHEALEIFVEDHALGEARASCSSAWHHDLSDDACFGELGDFFVRGCGAAEECVHVAHCDCGRETLPEPQDLRYANAVEAAAFR